MGGLWCLLRSRLNKKREQYSLNSTQCRLLGLRLPLLLVAVLTVATVAVFSSRIASPPQQRTLTAQFPNLIPESRQNRTESSQFQVQVQVQDKLPSTRRRSPPRNESSRRYFKPPEEAKSVKVEAATPLSSGGGGPYHDWDLFEADYEEMLQHLKIFVYPDALQEEQAGTGSPFAHVFLPHPNPFHNPKLGNYLSEHAFKATLLQSSLITHRPEEAHFFFMPFSINAMRNDPRLHSESSISDFVALYVKRISSDNMYWNASRGADHFYVCCHSVCREAASNHLDLRNNAIQVTCSSSYFQRFYVAHKDVALPQIWPRQPDPMLNPPEARTKLVFFAGRMQNSGIRQELLALWGNDTSMDITSGNSSLSYEVGFSKSRYCLHVKGYEVNTARVSDAIHYGCIPVLISNYYELPFSNVLEWSKFSVIINQRDILMLKRILLSISRQTYLNMYQNLCMVRKHFIWHKTPRNYDSFYMTAHQLWLKRGLLRLP